MQNPELDCWDQNVGHIPLVARERGKQSIKLCLSVTRDVDFLDPPS